MVKMMIAVAACLLLVGCGEHEPTKADKCNQFLDSIEQGVGQKYSPAERKHVMADCMKWGTGKAFWSHG